VRQTHDGELISRQFFERELAIVGTNVDAHIYENTQLCFRVLSKWHFPVRPVGVFDIHVFDEVKRTLGRLHLVLVLLSIAKYIAFHAAIVSHTHRAPRLGRLHALVTARIPRYPVHKPEDNMPIWVPTAISIFFGLASIFTMFYFKWVPDIEDQKRHMKGVGWWLFDLMTLGGQIVSIYMLAQRKGPVTPVFVVGAALIVGGLVLCIILFGFRRWVLFGFFRKLLDDVRKLIEIEKQQQEQIGRFLGLVERIEGSVWEHGKVLAILANEPNLSPEILRAIGTALNVEPDVRKLREANGLVTPKAIEAKSNE
jgi:uncharacterized membrane protein HdeD (DUF308 family)